MNKHYFLGAILALGTSLFGFSQKNLFMYSPRGLADKALVNELKSERVDAPSESELNTLKLNSGKDGHMYVVAKIMPFTADLVSAGTWTTLEDGGKLWRLQVESPGAVGLSFLFSHYEIPKGAVVFVYNPETGVYSNPEFQNDNVETKAYSTSFVSGEKVVLEYYQPADVKGNPKIEVEGVGYYFREKSGIEKRINEFGDAETCHPNSNCSEGTNKSDQRRSVVKIIVVDGGQMGFCSGALINNTAQDCKNYILSAQHCGAGASTSNMGQWKFYFNWESPNCPNPTYQQATGYDDQVLTGCTKKAASGTNTGLTKSDFLLVELSSAIPSTYNVYYAGWDRSTTAPSKGQGFHHPMGDIKKVSTFNNAAISSSWNGATSGSHWQVKWSATANGHGVTEGGSSGSPIFNDAGLIVGDLSGGSSYCSSPNSPDLYGKFSYSWASAGSTNATQLKPWLDPGNTGVTTLSGRNACDGGGGNNGGGNNGGGNNGGGSTSGCDTTGNFIIGTHQPYIIQLQNNGGYLAGNNNYGDLAKAEKFTSNTSGAQLKAVLYAFGAKSGNGTATLKVWNANGTNGTPGTELASVAAPLSNIPTGGNMIALDLSSNPITINGDFFAGVVLPTGSSTLALYTTDAGIVSGTTGYEQYSDGTWHSYVESYNNNFTHTIFKVLCTTGSGGSGGNGGNGTTEISEVEIAEGLKLYPNPANFEAYLISENGQKITSVKVVDMTGKAVYVQANEIMESASVIPVHTLSAGVYQVMVQINGTSWVAKKLVVSK